MPNNKLEVLRAMAESDFELALIAFLESLLYQMYVSEFSVVDGYTRHPNLVNFAEWMAMRFPAK